MTSLVGFYFVCVSYRHDSERPPIHHWGWPVRRELRRSSARGGGGKPHRRRAACSASACFAACDLTPGRRDSKPFAVFFLMAQEGRVESHAYRSDHLRDCRAVVESVKMSALHLTSPSTQP